MQELVQQTNGVARQSDAMMQMVQDAIGQANPERLPALLSAMFDFQLKVDARNAEIDFNRDFAAALMEMPKVVKRGKIDMGGKGSMKFATYEDSDMVIRPIEVSYGFARSFTTAPCENGVQMTLHLMHRGGHEKVSTLWMPPDTGAGRNAMQARGSAASYAKRYLTLDCWNIITVGEDNDGKTADPITTKQADEIRDILKESGSSPNNGQFLGWLKKNYGVDSLTRIQQYQFADIMSALDEARRSKQ